MWVQSLGQEHLLDEGMATYSSILAWRTPWTEEAGGVTKSQTRLGDCVCTHCKGGLHLWLYKRQKAIKNMISTHSLKLLIGSTN